MPRLEARVARATIAQRETTPIIISSVVNDKSIRYRDKFGIARGRST